MSIQEVSAERFAQLFHHYHQALASDSDAAADVHANDDWADLPPDERNRMVAATRLALFAVNQEPAERQGRQYFPKPGVAEWGC